MLLIDDVERLDDAYDGKPLQYHRVDNLIDPVVHPNSGFVPRVVADTLLLAKTGEPTSYA